MFKTRGFDVIVNDDLSMLAFLLSALVRVPWPGIALAALAWGLTGIGGIVYTAIVVRRMKSQTAYRPVFEDWLVHGILPLAAYAALLDYLLPYVRGDSAA